MNIVRHKTTELERQAIRNIVHRVHQLKPDTPATPSAGVTTLHTSRAHSGSVVAHWLRLKECPEDLAALKVICAAITHLAVESDGAPLVIIENLPIDDNASALPFLISSMIGELREYIGHGAPIVEVSDKAKIVDQRPSSDNNLTFDLHSDMTFYKDPPSFVCFLVLSQGSAGGESIFCDMRSTLERLSVETIAALQRPFRFPAPPHQPNQVPDFYPILKVAGSAKASVRYRRDRLEPLDSAQEQALIEFEREINSQLVEIRLLPGDMAVYSNTQLLHGRREFRDEPTLGKVRSALRAYADGVSAA